MKVKKTVIFHLDEQGQDVIKQFELNCKSERIPYSYQILNLIEKYNQTKEEAQK